MKGMTMSKVIEIITPEVDTVEVDTEDTTTKYTPKRRDLKKIGRHLARQITRQGITDMPLEAIMVAKCVDKKQAQSVVAHAKATLEARGLTLPEGVGA